MTKFIVISYDSSEKQTFWDRIVAQTPDAAAFEVSRERDYSVVVDVLDAGRLLTVATQLHAMTQSDVEAEWQETLDQIPS